MILDNESYLRLERRFLPIFHMHKDQLDNEIVNGIRHFVDVGELEMACEMFVLFSIEKCLKFDAAERRELLDLSLSLGLDRETVKRDDYWQIASAYLASD